MSATRLRIWVGDVFLPASQCSLMVSPVALSPYMAEVAGATHMAELDSRQVETLLAELPNHPAGVTLRPDGSGLAFFDLSREEGSRK